VAPSDSKRKLIAFCTERLHGAVRGHSKWLIAALPRFAASALFTGLMAVLSFVPAYAEYKLGPQDKVRVRVYEWRVASTQVHEWTALGGEFVVSAAGTVSLPLLGDVPATDRSPSALATDISERLQARIGLARRPDSAVDVIQYRPFYILGYVDKPGEYAYRPGMTVLEAIGLAGGLVRTADFRRLEREAIVSKGELQILEAERIAQLARQGRLQAELNATDDITFPRALLEQKESPIIAATMREERLLFTTRRETLRSQLESLTQVKSLLQSEIRSLEAKAVGLQRQLGFARQELEGVSKLVDRGLAVTSRRLSLEQTTAQFESSLLDLDLAKLRARQDISKAERDANDLVNRRNNEVLIELGNVRTKLAGMAEKQLMLQRLIRDSELIAPQQSMLSGGREQERLRLSIRRQIDGETNSKVVPETEKIHPGDVVQVELEGLDNPQTSRPTTHLRTPATDTTGAFNPNHTPAAVRP
jgi:protein involved in polysaccharide export with SLBB domain